MTKARRNAASPKPKGGKKKKSLKSNSTAVTLKPSPTKDSVIPDLNVAKFPHTTEQSDATLPANEKPPENKETITAKDKQVNDPMNQINNPPSDNYSNPSFKTVLLKKSEAEITDRANQSTFLLHKHMYDTGLLNQQSEDFPDDETCCANSANFNNRIRMRMLVKIPSKKQGISDDDAPFEAIKKINEMLKALTNKLPVKIGPWQYNSKSKIRPTAGELYTCLPEDVDIVEAYVFDYSRFIRAGKSGYFRLQLFFGDDTSPSEIKSVAAQFKKPKERFFEEAYSDATSPVHIGTLTGSVAAMATSKDFYEVFKTKFNLSELGLYFAIPRVMESTEWDKSRNSIHIEINRSDLQKRKNMETYFKSSRSLDNTFFGIPMILAPAFNYQAEDEVNLSLNNHTRKQSSLGKSIRSITISGIQVSNWADKTNKLTFLRELMGIESIHEKKVIKGKSSTSFKGRLYYGIIPDSISKTVTFYCSRANYMEGRSVARGLPLFIRDYFKLEPDFFCSSEALTDALNGDWDFAKREFQTVDEKVENDRLDNLENEMNAEREIFISKEHQIAMALDDDIISVETRLTKGDAQPPPVKNNTDTSTVKDASPPDDLSELTGSTRESKANRYAANAVKEVALQYTETLALKDADLGAKDDRIERLEARLKEMQTAQKGEDSDTNLSFEEENLASGNENKPEKRRNNNREADSPTSTSSKRRRTDGVDEDTPTINNVSRVILPRNAKDAASSAEDTSL